MQVYTQRKDLPKARHDAENGGQALFIHPWVGGADAPPAFRGAKLVGKLFDHDAERLVRTARDLGVRVIKIDRPGQPGQHIDLVDATLERALAQARERACIL